MIEVLYTGIDPARYLRDGVRVTHYPLIKTRARAAGDPGIQQALSLLSQATHLLFTSRMGVAYFSQFATQWTHLPCLTIGKATASLLFAKGCRQVFVSEKESSEGFMAYLEKFSLNDAFILYPHSSRARNVIRAYFKERGISFFAYPLYETEFCDQPLLDLNVFDKIVFTSPSTVQSFLRLYKTFPKGVALEAIGPVTQSYLHSL